MDKQDLSEDIRHIKALPVYAKIKAFHNHKWESSADGVYGECSQPCADLFYDRNVMGIMDNSSDCYWNFEYHNPEYH